MMQLKLTVLLLFVLSHYRGFELTLKQYISNQKKESIFQKLQQIQLDAFDNKLVKTKKNIQKRMNKGEQKTNHQMHQFALQSFKEIYDQGSLAYVATICLGKQCDVKCNDTKQYKFVNETSNKSTPTKYKVVDIEKPKYKMVSDDKPVQTKYKVINHRLKQKIQQHQQQQHQQQQHQQQQHQQHQSNNQIDICKQKSGREGIQANEFRVLLDTGSTNVFLVGNECNTKICENHQKYDEKWQQKQWDSAEIQRIGYISGDTIGKIIYDDLTIGGLDVDKQPLFIGSQVSLPIFEGSQWDGVMGLGYWYDPTKKTPEQEKSVIDNIIEQNLIQNKMFSYYIPEENVAKASFGEIVDELKDKLDKQNVVQWSSVEGIDVESQWQIMLYDIKLEKSQKAKAMNLQRFNRNNNSQKNKVLAKKIQFQHKMSVFMKKQAEFNNNPCGDKGCKLLIDTGTYLNYVPSEWFDKFFPKDIFKIDDQLCNSFDQFPDIVMVLKHWDSNQQYHLRMKGPQYMDKIGDRDHMCNPSFCPDTTEDNLITLGQVFLKNFYTIFDFGSKKKRIGFYPIESLRKLRKKI